MKARVLITMKPSILDPQGKTVHRSAVQMGYEEIESIRIGKLIEVELKDNCKNHKQRLDDLSKKLLSNPQIENYTIEWFDE